eukprot:TRINITY_DN1984_c0_g1_i1.p4 TRINITY_DN1984_c0_g1~~TRINITY_DN1984_c0_g1_i1.p4  ORF type:complete len:400 (+),score=64.39 TRINITY_DN1984_c0_g1_i1:2140-3339(+)
MYFSNTKHRSKDSHDKDVMIAQLNAELFETKKKQRSYLIMKTRIVELERKFRALQEEKRLLEADTLTREKDLQAKNQKLEKNIAELAINIEKHDETLAKQLSEIDNIKGSIEEKNLEVAKIKSELATKTAFNTDFVNTRRFVEEEIEAEKMKCETLQQEMERIIDENDKLSRTQSKKIEKVQENSLSILRLNRSIESTKTKFNEARSYNKSKTVEVLAANEVKKHRHAEKDRVTVQNNAIIEENKRMSLEIKDLGLRINRLKQQIDDSGSLLEIKEKEIESSKNELASINNITEDVLSELYKEQAKNQWLRKEVEAYEAAVKRQNKNREEEFMKTLELGQMNKALRKWVLEKELESTQEYKLLGGRYAIEKKVGDYNALSDIQKEDVCLYYPQNRHIIH